MSEGKQSSQNKTAAHADGLDTQNGSLLQDLASLQQRVDRSPTPQGTKPLGTIGPYSLIREIGAGGMGKVYEAYDARLSRKLAIKVLKPGVAEAVKRFHREAELLSRLNHPHIVRFYETGKAPQGDYDYIVMELIEGESLAKEMAHGRMPRERVVRILLEVADAVQYAHEQGIIHRDLKPGNILLEKQSGRAVLLDFGLAKDVLDPGHLTRTGTMMGTCRYMAPEQVSASFGKVTEQTDVWALGAVMYEMLTGKYAVEGETEINVLNNIVDSEIVPLRNVDESIPVELEEICLKALSKDKSRRYQSAQEMAQAIKNSQQAQSKGTGRGRGVRIRKSRNEKRRNHKLRIFPLGVMAMLLVIATASWLLLRNEPTKPIANKPKIAAPAAQHKIPDGWPAELWQACWNVAGDYCDFSQEAWVNLPHDKQFACAQAYQAWYAKRKELELDKVIEKSGAKFEFRLVPQPPYSLKSLPFWQEFEIYQEIRNRRVFIGICQPQTEPTKLGEPAILEAIRCRNLLNEPTIHSQTDIAQELGITRARVCQIMGLLKLAPQIQQELLSMTAPQAIRYFGERRLRSLLEYREFYEQIEAFEEMKKKLLASNINLQS